MRATSAQPIDDTVRSQIVFGMTVEAGNPPDAVVDATAWAIRFEAEGRPAGE